MKKEKTGRIISISGATVRTDLRGLTLFEKVSVGEQNLTGEVVRLDKDSAVLQVYEDPGGLGLHEPIQGHGTSLTTALGPGLLSAIFDGLQRPLDLLNEKTGSFIHPVHLASSLDLKKKWEFTPSVSIGDTVEPGTRIGSWRSLCAFLTTTACFTATSIGPCGCRVPTGKR